MHCVRFWLKVTGDEKYYRGQATEEVREACDGMW